MIAHISTDQYTYLSREVPGHPEVRTSLSNMGGEGSIPGQGAKIPHASWSKNQNMKKKKKKQYYNKFNKEIF